MIKIIKPGTKHVFICHECGCKFSYEDEDVVEKDINNYKGFTEYVVCPQCQSEVIIRQSR